MRIILLALAIVFSLVNPAFSKTRKNTKPHIYPALMLSDYIGIKCSKNCVDSEQLKEITTQASKQFNINPILLISIIKVESAFNIKAKSSGNVGLLQINLKYHKKKFGTESVFNQDKNILIGARIFKECLIKYSENINKALRCYNGGMDNNYPKKVIKTSLEIASLIDFKVKGNNDWIITRLD